MINNLPTTISEWIPYLIVTSPALWLAFFLGEVRGFNRRSRLIRGEWDTINSFKNMKNTALYQKGYKEAKAKYFRGTGSSESVAKDSFFDQLDTVDQEVVKKGEELMRKYKDS